MFREFVAELEALGYSVQWRVLNAADYGAPTSRKRLFLVARRDGHPIVWPTPTHGKGREPYRTAAECIDWSIPIPSIFDRKKSLAEATQRRIAEGIRRYVLESSRPFLVNLTHGARVESIDEPVRTVTGANRGEKAIVVPTLMSNNTNNAPHSVEDPLGTITSGNRHYLVSPSLVQMGYGERPGQKPRVLNLHAPLGAVVAGGKKHGLVAVFIAKHHGSRERWSAAIGQHITDPLHTIISHDNKSVVACHIESMYSNSNGRPIDDTLPTMTAGSNHHALVATFLQKYYGSGGQWQAADDPLHTMTNKARFGLVTVTIDGEDFVVVDIGMRMLAPRELARTQGFPDSYILTGTETQQVARIGNSVVPHVAAAIVSANLVGDGEERRAA